MDEQVIGLVLEKHAETFNVDVGGPFAAALSVLAFEVSPEQSDQFVSPWPTGIWTYFCSISYKILKTR